MKWPWNKSTETIKPLYYDLRLTQIEDNWFWEIYFEHDRIAFGREPTVQKAFRAAHNRAKPHKIITAHINREH